MRRALGSCKQRKDPELAPRRGPQSRSYPFRRLCKALCIDLLERNDRGIKEEVLNAYFIQIISAGDCGHRATEAKESRTQEAAVSKAFLMHPRKLRTI